MKNKCMIIAKFFWLFLIPTVSLAADIACDDFRVDESGDVFAVDAQGNPCYEPDLKIRIAAEDGQSIFQYDSKLNQHTAISWDDPELERYAKKIVLKVLKDISKSEEELPDPRTGQQIKIPGGGYTLLRKRTGPTSTYCEGQITLKYDEKTETARIIMEAGF